MSAYMRDWISPLVERELVTASEGKSQVAKTSDSHVESGRLIVRLTEGKSIQINEFISHSPEYLLWVSDSFTRIQAVFTKRATESFQKKYKRPFSKGTLGAVVGITDYSLSPRSKRVMLKVESFTLQGSEGSGNFGNPILVEELETIKTLISHLSGQFDSSSSSHTNSPQDSPSPVRSQAGSCAESSSSPENATHSTFATQAPHDVNVAIYSQSHMVKNQSCSRKSSLLDLLGANQPTDRFRRTHSDNPKSKGESSELQGNFSGSPRPNTSDPTPTFLVNAIDKALMNHKSSSQSNTQDSLAMSTVTSIHNAYGSATLASTDMNITRATPDKGFASTSNGTETEKENLRVAIVGSRNSRGSAVPNSSNEEVAAVCRDEDTISPWRDLTRIPRRYVQIPKDQQKLLGRDDSWYSQKLDNQKFALVPDNVLTELKAFHGREVHLETDTDVQNENSSGDPREASENGSETESDRGISRPLESLRVSNVGGSQHDQLSFQYTVGHQHSLSDGTQRFEPQAYPISSDECPTRPENNTEGSEASSGDHYMDAYSSYSQGLQRDAQSEANLNSTKKRALDDTLEHSSSPLEMEIEVPLGLPSTAEGPQLDLQVERTPYAKSGILLLPSLLEDLLETTFTQPTQKTSARDEPENQSSDLVIPATFDGETVIHLHDSNKFTTKMCPMDIDVCASSSIVQENDISARHQLHTNFNTTSQRSNHTQSNAPITATPESFLSGRMTAGLDRHSPRANAINMADSSSPSAVLHLSIPSTQRVALPDLQSWNESQGGEEPPLNEPQLLKRNLSNASKSPEPAWKRQRSIRFALFSSSQDDEPMVDPSEMAKANRRDFLRQFAILQDNSNGRPEQSEHGAPLSTTNTSKEVRPDKIQNHNTSTNTPAKQKQESLFLSPDKGLDVTNQFHEAPDKDIHNANGVDSNHGEAHSDLMCRYVMPSAADLTFYTSEVLDGSLQMPDLDDVSSESKNFSSGKNALEMPVNLFQKFCLTYPTYTESMNTFIKACVYLKQQRDKKKAPLPILWDDFIRLFSTEYPLYVKDCQLTAQAPMNGIAYYNNFVDEPFFNERIVTIASLPEALLLDPKVTSSSQELIQQASYSYKSQLSTLDSLRASPGINKRCELSQTPIEHASANPAQNQESSRGACLPDSQKETLPLKDQANCVRSSSENRNYPRNPSFETPSQLLVQQSRSFINSSTSKVSSPPTRRIGAIIVEQNRSAKIDLPPATISRDNMRRLPWSSQSYTGSSPRNILKTDQEVESHLESSNSLLTRKAQPLRRNERNSGDQSPGLPPSRHGSPILGSNVSESISTTGSMQGSAWPRPMRLTGTSLEPCAFKTPSLPVYKHFGRKTKSMPGSRQTSEHKFEKPAHDWSSMMESKKRLRAFVPAPVATFKEFSKAFMPRRKHMSSVLSESSTPRSVTLPVKRQLAKQGHEPPDEPETQAWTF